MSAVEERARELFGFERLRSWQQQAVDELLEGDGKVLVVAPTGGGKSACYQLPASMLPGTTVVVSPLIALMEDQVRALTERGVPATYLASTLDREERRRRTERLAAGDYKLVYVAPERLRSAELVALLESLAPPLVAIDEAHCISQWGHDFRPDYLRIGELLAKLKPPRVLACTATATPLVRDEILTRLGMPDAPVVLHGFARPNLHLEVREIDSKQARHRTAMQAIRERLGAPGEPRGAAIAYAGTRRATEQLAGELGAEGWRVAAYHAGLAPDVRERTNAAFAAGELDVVVATNAFGMGIDRPDIRAVVHTQAPGSIEAYYQEVGRAGRDGAPAYGLLLSGTSDYGFRRRLIDYGVEQRCAAEGRQKTPAEEVEAARQWNLFLDLMRYVEAGSCRHDYILRYFDDEQETLGGCGHCDVCARLGPSAAETPGEQATLVVRQALSGVARCKQRAGLNNLAHSLAGKTNAVITRHGLDRLSTHGLLGDRDANWILALLRRLLTAGLIDLTAGDYPMPFLTKLGVDTMKGVTPVRVLLPPQKRPKAERRARHAPAPASSPGANGAELEPELFERLRDVRLELAREREVPAYVICGNKTLEDMARRHPRSLAQMYDVYGMGEHRVGEFGQRFLEVLASDQS